MVCQVHVLDVGAGKTCPLCAYCAIPKKFRGNHVSGARGEFKTIINQVTANIDTNAVRVFFLWMMIDANMTRGDCLVSRDVLHLFKGKGRRLCWSHW